MSTETQDFIDSLPPQISGKTFEEVLNYIQGQHPERYEEIISSETLLTRLHEAWSGEGSGFYSESRDNMQAQSNADSGQSEQPGLNMAGMDPSQIMQYIPQFLEQFQAQQQKVQQLENHIGQLTSVIEQIAGGGQAAPIESGQPQASAPSQAPPQGGSSSGGGLGAIAQLLNGNGAQNLNQLLGHAANFIAAAKAPDASQQQQPDPSAQIENQMGQAFNMLGTMTKIFGDWQQQMKYINDSISGKGSSYGGSKDEMKQAVVEGLAEVMGQSNSNDGG